MMIALHVLLLQYASSHSANALQSPSPKLHGLKDSLAQALQKLLIHRASLRLAAPLQSRSIELHNVASSVANALANVDSQELLSPAAIPLQSSTERRRPFARVPFAMISSSFKWSDGLTAALAMLPRLASTIMQLNAATAASGARGSSSIQIRTVHDQLQ